MRRQVQAGDIAAIAIVLVDSLRGKQPQLTAGGPHIRLAPKTHQRMMGWATWLTGIAPLGSLLIPIEGMDRGVYIPRVYVTAAG